jgi:hypothetical protein
MTVTGSAATQTQRATANATSGGVVGFGAAQTQRSTAYALGILIELAPERTLVVMATSRTASVTARSRTISSGGTC